MIRFISFDSFKPPYLPAPHPPSLFFFFDRAEARRRDVLARGTICL